MRRRIAILLPDLRGGGVERIRLVLAREFARKGHTVEFVLLRERGELLEEAKAEFPVHALKAKRLRQAVRPLVQYLRQRRPDALLAAMWPLTGIAALAKRLSGSDVQLIASEHTDLRMTQAIGGKQRLMLRYFGRWLYKPCRCVVAVSSGVADSLSEVAKLPAAQVKVINNPVRSFPDEDLDKEERQHVSRWLKGKVRLIAIGSLIAPKGYDILLQAISILRQNHDARLLILGEGPIRPKLEQLSETLGLTEHVLLPGFQRNPGAFLKHADVFVLSSNWEGFGNVIVEALSAGIPVVSADCMSGPREILEDGRYGILVPVGEPAMISDAISRVLEKPPLPVDLVKRSKDFAIEKKAKEYLELFFE